MTEDCMRRPANSFLVTDTLIAGQYYLFTIGPQLDYLAAN